MITFSDIVKRVQSLPPLLDITLKIQALYKKGAEHVDVRKLIKLIESDATLTANVLKFVNAPKYGFSKKISSVAQAVTLLGTEVIYGLVLDYAIHEKLKANISTYGITNIQFNDICHLQSALLLQWYSLIDTRDAQFLAPLALIMELGKLVIAKEISQSSYATRFRRGLAGYEDVVEYEYDLLGTTSYFVTGLLFEQWNLDLIFVEILETLDFTDEQELSPRVEYYRGILDVVRSTVNVKGILTDNSIANGSKIVREIGLSEDTFLRVARRLKRSYEESKGLA